MLQDKWIEFAVELQSLAQAGLAYGKDVYDLERYTRIREIAAEMIACKSDIPLEKVKNLFCNETGYQTPKVDTRAAVFKEGKILLVHEKNGTWSLPGGWCDVNQSVAENTVKETLEEAGLNVKPVRMIAVQDRNKHNDPPYAYGIVKVFILCEVISGAFTENIETTVNMDPSARKPSFTSARNPEPDSVQVILRTESITKPEEDVEDVNEDGDNRTFLQRLGDVFQKIWNTITGLFQ